MSKTQSYYSSIAARQMENLKGGCPVKQDCILNGTGCNEDVPCQAPCVPRWACNDLSLGERCIVVFDIGYDLPCWTDPAYLCTGTVWYSGPCPNGWCTISHVNETLSCLTTVQSCHDGWW
jgi:hypothetical protein